jgi:hypothetical protein
MEALIDNVARILASPLSRREAIRRIATLVGASAVWGLAGRQDVHAASCHSCCTVDQGKRVCPPGVCCCVKMNPPPKGDDGTKGNSGALCKNGPVDAATGVCVDATGCCAPGNCLCKTGCTPSKGSQCPADCFPT